MENSIKPKLSEEQVELIVERVCGKRVKSFKELSDGWANAAYLVALEDGQEIIIKAAPPTGTRMMRYEKGLMKAEVETMRLVKSAGRVPVPHILAYDSTCEIADCEYFVMEKLDGVPYNKIKGELSVEKRESIEYELGQCNRLINELRSDSFGLYAEPAALGTTWKEAFHQLLLGVLADGEEAGVELPVEYAVVRQEVEARLYVLDDVTEPRLVHWDIWDGNVFVKDGQIVGIIDFERALWGDPLTEAYFGRFFASDAFLRGYGFVNGLSNKQRQRRLLYDLYLDLILCVECAFRGYTDSGHIGWTKRNLADGWNRFLTQFE